jgi:hypothetical protein
VKAHAETPFIAVLTGAAGRAAAGEGDRDGEADGLGGGGALEATVATGTGAGGAAAGAGDRCVPTRYTVRTTAASTAAAAPPSLQVLSLRVPSTRSVFHRTVKSAVAVPTWTW